MPDLYALAEQVAQNHMDNLEYSAVYESDEAGGLTDAQMERVYDLARTASLTITEAN